MLAGTWLMLLSSKPIEHYVKLMAMQAERSALSIWASQKYTPASPWMALATPSIFIKMGRPEER